MNLSESDIENIFIDKFQRFSLDFQYILQTLITWLQDASLEAGSWPNFPCVTQIEEYGRKSYHGEFSMASGTTSLSCNIQYN